MKKLEIISHRGGFLPEGPIPEVKDKYTIAENTIVAFKRAIENGWGIETDVRLAKNGQFVLSHDDISQATPIGVPTLDELCQLAPPFIAFQVKRGAKPNSGLEIGRAVAKKMEQYGLKNSILFDSTIDEAEILRDEFPWLNLSVSVGEENYNPTIYTPDQVLTKKFRKIFNCIWADEWKKPGSIYNRKLFDELRAAYSGRIDVISPELHYNENHLLSKDLNKLKEFWRKLFTWNVADGICTDYPTALEQVLKSF